MSEPVPGQIWKEIDPRSERYVRIEGVFSNGRKPVGIRTVQMIGGCWEPAPRSRVTWCDINRFNGKRGGYAIYQASDT